MLVGKILFNIDFKHKTFYLYHDDNNTEQVIVDEDGNGELLLDMFKSLNMEPLKGFIDELNEKMTKDQTQAVFQLWGSSNQIMISDMTDILKGDRVLAKSILKLGIERGVLGRGVNSTWKVIDKEIQKTMKDSAIRTKRGIMKGAPSTEESMKRIQKQREEFGLTNEGEQGMIEKHESKTVHNSKVSSKSKSVDVIPDEPLIEEPIIELLLPEEPIKVNVQLEAMRKRKRELEKIISEVGKHDDIHKRVIELNSLKGQIIKVENEQSSQYINTGIKMNESGSAMKVIKKESTQTPRRLLAGSKGILSKGKPAQVKGVRNPKKPITR